MGGIGLVLAFLLNGLGMVERLELATYDLRFRLRGERPADAPIVIVAINDESFNALGQNLHTWPRTDYARLIDAIAAGGPSVIGVDVAWTHAGTDAGGDEALARSLQQAERVVLTGLIEHQEGPGYAYDRYAPPIEPLDEAATDIGLSNVALDVDGVVRRVVLRRLHNDVWHPAFGLAVAEAHRGELPPSAGATAQYDLLINFRGGANTFITVPMYQVLSGEVAPETFSDKIALIGFTTLLEQDLHVTPFDRAGLTPGVEVHANVVATLLKDDPIRRAPAWLALLLNLGAIGLTILAFWRLKPVGATVIAGGSVLLYLAAAFFLFAATDLWLPVVSPVGLAALTAAGGLVEMVLVEEQEKRRIRDRFQSFMAPERLTAGKRCWKKTGRRSRPRCCSPIFEASPRRPRA
jgi:hypothetical protein